jgi:hypothetical protein
VDGDAWLKRLKESGAEYLFIGKPKVWSLDPAIAQRLNPPELGLVNQYPAVFTKLLSSEESECYRIHFGQPASSAGQNAQ